MTMDDLLFSADLSSVRFRQKMGAGDSGYWMGCNKIPLVAALKETTEKTVKMKDTVRVT